MRFFFKGNVVKLSEKSEEVSVVKWFELTEMFQFREHFQGKIVSNYELSCKLVFRSQDSTPKCWTTSTLRRKYSAITFLETGERRWTMKKGNLLKIYQNAISKKSMSITSRYRRAYIQYLVPMARVVATGCVCGGGNFIKIAYSGDTMNTSPPESKWFRDAPAYAYGLEWDCNTVSCCFFYI